MSEKVDATTMSSDAAIGANINASECGSSMSVAAARLYGKQRSRCEREKGDEPICVPTLYS